MNNLTLDSTFSMSNLNNYPTGDRMDANSVTLAPYPSYPWFQPYVPIVEHYYPVYQQYWLSPDKSKLEQSFKIVQKLIEKKLVKIDKVKEFIELVNDIVEVL